MGGPIKGRADYYEPGDWNVACSMCGRKRKASELVRNWQGLWRCPIHNEPRQPQDFVANVKDVMTVAFDQPETNLPTAICTWNGLSAYPGWAEPGCSIPGRNILTLEDMPMEPFFPPPPIGPPVPVKVLGTISGLAIITQSGLEIQV